MTDPQSPTLTPVAASHPERLLSIDALRGFDMFWIKVCTLKHQTLSSPGRRGERVERNRPILGVTVKRRGVL